MGCSTSSQTSAVDTSRPTAKTEESNGASTTGAANENGNVAEDSETIPDQTPAQGAEGAQPVDEAAASADGAAATAVPPAEKEESQQAAAAASSESTTAAQNAGENPEPAETPATAETAGPTDAGAAADTAESSGEPAAAAADDQEKAAATSADPQTNTDQQPAPCE